MDGAKAGSAGDPLKEADLSSSAEPKAASDVKDVGNAPDPDEDDLDDLDDMLEEFSTVKLNSKADVPKPAAGTTPATASASASTGPTVADGALDTEETLAGLDDFSEEEFQKQLQAGMAELMGDLEASASLALTMR